MLEKRELRFPLLSPTIPSSKPYFFSKKSNQKNNKKKSICYSQIGFFKYYIMYQKTDLDISILELVVCKTIDNII